MMPRAALAETERKKDAASETGHGEEEAAIAWKNAAIDWKNKMSEICVT